MNFRKRTLLQVEVDRAEYDSEVRIQKESLGSSQIEWKDSGMQFSVSSAYNGCRNQCMCVYSKMKNCRSLPSVEAC